MKSTQQRIAAIVFSFASALLSINTVNAQSSSGYTNLIDGVSLEGWNIVGNANWVIGNGIIEGNKPNGFLVSTKSYKNFIIRAEFWAESNTNSGIFLRCQDPTKIAAATSYEVNIWDTRPGQEYSTGAIVDVAKVNPIHKAGGRWNTMEIVANGSGLKVSMNGAVTVDVKDSKFADGPIALQSAGGTIKFRKLEIKPI
ncbi:DUF1080 domain-containing protein [Polynucleobacter sp. UB-Piko-W3]|uniref:3-keto-disaccharide hydrolase n=1 Tax=Polynucleobacter sp. UB-Piko-W3 TaxID=1819735 RepID=UPI001C0E5F65|nr:DUF1080 domain-containing protein [Polynucleobacter sp. UB-Piko-W3]MBU3554892.1 DUF1080 domain-containing protein [Polynucleobacter sp. UB-Piko-W3]